MENGKKKLLPKSKGTLIMISGFICQCHGFMSGNDNKKTYQTFEAGTARDGWFTNEDLVKRFQGCVGLMKELHLNIELVIAFDISMTHRARAPDGLDASRLNFSDGGASVIKHDGQENTIIFVLMVLR
jgi:hypothetical protein